MKIFARLAESFPHLPAEERFSLAKHTTIGCGGVADVAAYPRDEEEAAALFAYLSRERIPHFLLGVGANVLPDDGRYEGVVVRLSRLNGLFCGDGELYAGAGVTGNALLAYSAAKGAGGFEPFAGIPMSVGGAVAMNAGIPTCHVSDLVLRVVAAEGGRIYTLSADACGFSEKSSVFSEKLAVLGASFRTEARTKAEIAENVGRYRARRAALPAGHSMGCTFVNPAGRSAGALIEACGLKGLRCGGAHVSEIHANFIINRGDRAADVATLADTVKEEVFRKTGILLREEIRRFRFSP